MELNDILKITSAVDRRGGLRKVLTPLFDANSKIIKASIERSPLVGKGPNQVDIRARASALRDALDIGTLIWLADDPSTHRLYRVLDAIIEPDKHGRPSATAKTGYVFGRPYDVTEETIADIITNRTKGAAPMTATTELGLALSTLIDIFDSVYIDTGRDHGEIFEAMKVALPGEAARMGAVGKAVILRGDAPEGKPVLDSIASGIVSQVVHNLSAAGAFAGRVSLASIPKVDPVHEGMINAVLNAAKLPPINHLIDQLNKACFEIAELKAKPAHSITLMPPGVTVSAPPTGGKPAGRVTTAKAWSVFGMPEGGSFEFEVPVWEWDFAHPDTKAVDPNYIFRHDELLSALYALLTNERCWLHGHTGTGKTTLIEQIAARLNWPVRVVNLDSEITRMDLIGRDTLVNEGGTTVSKFVDGILPQCMTEPYILIFDEFDYIRPDVSYVAQRALEGNGLTITEDGGRLVVPHPMFRIFATGNTQGQGDDYGMYAGARVQSMALLDRFTAWIAVDYLPEDKRVQLLKTSVPGLDAGLADKVGKYVTEHIQAFKTAKVVKPISPRGMIALGKAIANFCVLMPAADRTKAVELALDRTILNACTQQDKVVLKGIANRVFA